MALSFVRTAEEVRAAMPSCALWDTRHHWWSSWKKPEALEHLDGILGAADAVMVARGDLGVEMSPGARTRDSGSGHPRSEPPTPPVITATEMLQSMITRTRPTRARPPTWQMPSGMAPMRSCSQAKQRLASIRCSQSK